MTPEEAHLALKRHATSKLKAIDDLFTLSSMGFRGEALPSIAAVSQLRLTTRARDAAAGDGAYQLMVEGGIAGAGREVGAPVGTRIEVRDLLLNVPARLKFLKGETTESAHVAETVLRLALAFPTVHFRLRSGGRLTLDLPPHASGLERARVALGRGKHAGEAALTRAARRAASPSRPTSARRPRAPIRRVAPTSSSIDASCATAASCTRCSWATARCSSAGAIRWRWCT